MSEWYLKPGHDSFLSSLFQVHVYQSSYRSCSVTCVFEKAVLNQKSMWQHAIVVDNIKKEKETKSKNCQLKTKEKLEVIISKLGKGN
jgi:hypothetical protein